MSKISPLQRLTLVFAGIFGLATVVYLYFGWSGWKPVAGVSLVFMLLSLLPHWLQKDTAILAKKKPDGANEAREGFRLHHRIVEYIANWAIADSSHTPKGSFVRLIVLLVPLLFPLAGFILLVLAAVYVVEGWKLRTFVGIVLAVLVLFFVGYAHALRRAWKEYLKEHKTISDAFIWLSQATEQGSFIRGLWSHSRWFVLASIFVWTHFYFHLSSLSKNSDLWLYVFANVWLGVLFWVLWWAWFQDVDILYQRSEAVAEIVANFEDSESKRILKDSGENGNVQLSSTFKFDARLVNEMSEKQEISNAQEEHLSRVKNLRKPRYFKALFFVVFSIAVFTALTLHWNRVGFFSVLHSSKLSYRAGIVAVFLLLMIIISLVSYLKVRKAPEVIDADGDINRDTAEHPVYVEPILAYDLDGGLCVENVVVQEEVQDFEAPASKKPSVAVPFAALIFGVAVSLVGMWMLGFSPQEIILVELIFLAVAFMFWKVMLQHISQAYLVISKKAWSRLYHICLRLIPNENLHFILQDTGKSLCMDVGVEGDVQAIKDTMKNDGSWSDTKKELLRVFNALLDFRTYARRNRAFNAGIASFCIALILTVVLLWQWQGFSPNLHIRFSVMAVAIACMCIAMGFSFSYCLIQPVFSRDLDIALETEEQCSEEHNAEEGSISLHLNAVMNERKKNKAWNNSLGFFRKLWLAIIARSAAFFQWMDPILEKAWVFSLGYLVIYFVSLIPYSGHKWFALGKMWVSKWNSWVVLLLVCMLLIHFYLAHIRVVLVRLHERMLEKYDGSATLSKNRLDSMGGHYQIEGWLAMWASFDAVIYPSVSERESERIEKCSSVATEEGLIFPEDCTKEQWEELFIQYAEKFEERAEKDAQSSRVEALAPQLVDNALIARRWAFATSSIFGVILGLVMLVPNYSAVKSYAGSFFPTTDASLKSRVVQIQTRSKLQTARIEFLEQELKIARTNSKIAKSILSKFLKKYNLNATGLSTDRGQRELLRKIERKILAQVSVSGKKSRLETALVGARTRLGAARAKVIQLEAQRAQAIRKNSSSMERLARKVRASQKKLSLRNQKLASLKELLKKKKKAISKLGQKNHRLGVRLTASKKHNRRIRVKRQRVYASRKRRKKRPSRRKVKKKTQSVESKLW